MEQGLSEGEREDSKGSEGLDSQEDSPQHGSDSISQAEEESEDRRGAHC